MSRLATSFVLGYHGCDASVADALISGTTIKPSDREYDWLGPGAYFWESDPHRAREFAEWKVSRNDYKVAAVVGAVIDLRNCLDMSNRENVRLFQAFHANFLALQTAAGLPVPQNQNAKGDPYEDRVLRFLDRAVFVHIHKSMEAARAADPHSAAPLFDTVRGVFTEGGQLYDGCGFHERTHVQIAVRNVKECIIGIFEPLHV